ncbi:hypothetical protein [Psychrobacter aquaticus]|uniref:Uncharacterized protein n=1 Tax=Psychrobacter aquaticus CMS 56 TaxID=1354303 RepID=U4TAS9_9GAMM|nr:hypothetical protein [Psychrobacter aquaticus]ERL55563.1 hypothetical protein M917_1573 [Psychrobacter aquaticus CMS 56]
MPDTYSMGWNFNEHFHGKGYASKPIHDFIDKNGLDGAIIQTRT